MGLFAHTNDRELADAKEDFQYRLDIMEAAVQRGHKKREIETENTISVLQARLKKYDSLNYTAEQQLETGLELERRVTSLDHREELIAQRAEQFDKVKKLHEEDMKHHHENINDLQGDAKKALSDAQDVLVYAKEELMSTKSTSRTSGYNDGFADGLKSGFDRFTALLNSERADHTQSLGLSTLAGAMGHSPVAGDKPDEASKALSDAFAKHLTGTINRVMDTNPKQETK